MLEIIHVRHTFVMQFHQYLYINHQLRIIFFDNSYRWLFLHYFIILKVIKANYFFFAVLPTIGSIYHKILVGTKNLTKSVPKKQQERG